MDADYFRMLFDYVRWANARILDRCAEVSEADYFAEFPGLSFKNLHGTLLHLVGSERVWFQRWIGQPTPQFNVENTPDLRALLKIRAEVEPEQAAYFTKLTDAELDRPNTYKIPNGEMTHLLGHQMAHWANHGTQYRSEAAVRLTALDLSPGGLDLAGWLHNR